MITRTVRFISALIAFALTLAACGGGGGAASGPVANPNPGGNTGGITRTGNAVAVGPITGFGSVIVNGVTYDTSSATFTQDGTAATEADFKVGQYVLVQGTIDSNNTTGSASSVSFDDNVEGPVSSVDSAAGSFIILGQTVSVNGNTSFDDSCPATLDDLLGVASVEVSGPVLADGTIAATRVECKAIAGELEVTGTVSNHNAGAMTFQINALVVDYSGASVEDFPTAGIINDGDPVEAKGNALGGAGELRATRVEYKGAEFANNEGDHVEVEGFITRFVSATDFDVTGIPVTTNGATAFEGGAANDLGLNLKVEVEGEFDANGVLLATKVEIKQATSVRVTGRIDTISGSTVLILNIPVTTDSLTTRFEDKSNADVDPLSIGDLNVDDYVEVRGQEFPAGSGEIRAVLLEREDPRPETELRGFVEVGGVNRPTLTILGVTIDTNGSTVYRDALDQVMLADDFWAAVGEGTLVEAEGTETGVSALLAEELELED
ncbi:MAG: DUF5666 domain-containing protein [Woeseiaceae bacterium]|nr:DUF5666 domain-containing protein [Woeseiaceae bacterium]